MFPGIEIQIDGKTHIVPALSLKQLREGGMELMKKTDELAAAGGNGYDTMASRAALIHMALTRNYPDMTLAKVEENLDLGNTVKIWLVVLGVSGLGDKGPLGEASALMPEPTNDMPATVN